MQVLIYAVALLATSMLVSQHHSRTEVILDRMVPRSCFCLQLPDPRQSAALAAEAGAEARQHFTLAEMLYPPPSWETEVAATPSRRSSPKVCPVNNLADLFCDEEEEADSPPGVVNDSVSMSFVSRASLHSVSHSRRVSFRSPDESDVFIIPARSHSHGDDDDDEWSSDGEPSRT